MARDEQVAPDTASALPRAIRLSFILVNALFKYLRLVLSVLAVTSASVMFRWVTTVASVSDAVVVLVTVTVTVRVRS